MNDLFNLISDSIEQFVSTQMKNLSYYLENFEPDLSQVDLNEWNSVQSKIHELFRVIQNSNDYTEPNVIEAFWTLVTITVHAVGDHEGDIHVAWTVNDVVKSVLNEGFLDIVSDIVETHEPMENLAVFYPLVNLLTHFTSQSETFCSIFNTSSLFSSFLHFFEKDFARVDFLEAVPADMREVLIRGITSVLVIFANTMDLHPPSKTNFINLDGENYVKEYLSSENIELKLTAVLTLAVSSDTNDEHASKIYETTKESIEFVMENMSKVLEIKSSRKIFQISDYFISNGLTVVKAVTLLARNNLNAQKIVQSGAFAVLRDILVTSKNDKQLITSSLNAVWALCFEEKNKKPFRDDETLVNCIKEIAKTGDSEASGVAKGILWETKCSQRTEVEQEAEALQRISKDLQKIIDAQSGITDAVAIPTEDVKRMKTMKKRKATKELEGHLIHGRNERVVLDSELEESTKSMDSSAPAEPTKHVMISYCWAQQALALKIREKLEASGFNVWIDVNKMQGFLLDSMADAVENAFAVIICVSEQYRVSHACRSEANYCFELKRPVVPVISEPGYFPSGGWLRFLISGILYYELFDDAGLEKSFPKIVNYLVDLSSDQKPNEPAHNQKEPEKESNGAQNQELSEPERTQREPEVSSSTRVTSSSEEPDQPLIIRHSSDNTTTADNSHSKSKKCNCCVECCFSCCII